MRRLSRRCRAGRLGGKGLLGRFLLRGCWWLCIFQEGGHVSLRVFLYAFSFSLFLKGDISVHAEVPEEDESSDQDSREDDVDLEDFHDEC